MDTDTPSSYGQTSSTLWGPKLLHKTRDSENEDPIEISVHTLPKPLQREFQHVFNESNLPFEMNTDSNAEILAIPTNQRAREDLVGVGDNVEKEKDRLLNVFFDFAKELCEKIKSAGYWADFIDPCSGLPMMTMNCNKVYSEVDGMETLLGYRAYNAGFCKILTHPAWGSAVYPATLFAHAPRQVVIDIMNAYPTVDITNK